MRYLLYGMLAGSLVGGAAIVSRSEPAAAQQENGQKKEQEEELEDFTPTEKVPAGSSISFPVDI